MDKSKKNRENKEKKQNKEKIKIFSKNKEYNILAITAGIVALILAVSIFIQFRTVKQSEELDIEGLREDELRTQIASYKSKYEETIKQYEENQNKINDYTTAMNENKETSEILDEELLQSKTILGLTDVTGSGVIVTLTDTPEALYTYTADDILLLINELKYAGAEAISINDNRVINLTDIVMVTDTLIVMNGGNTRISSPYEIKAIGDPKYLMSTLSMKNSGYIDQMEANGMKIDVRQENNIKINAYSGEIDSKYLKEVE